MHFNRFRAASAHLLFSAAIAASCAALVFSLWYPGPLAGASGVVEIFLLLLAVDVCLGPLITLIVFNPKKKELNRDLTLVVIVQLVALLYGMSTVFVARPVYIVFNADRFDLIYATDLGKEKLEKVTAAQYKKLPIFGPVVISARRPTDTKSRNEILFSALAGGDDLPQLPQYYAPYSDAQADVVKRLESVETLVRNNQSKAAEISRIVSRHVLNANDIGYLPLKGKTKDAVVLLTRKGGALLEIVDLKPWP